MPPPATLTEPITVTPLDGPPVVRTATSDPRREYIAAGAFLWLPALLQALPRYIDDVTRDFGRDLYERMLWDPAVQSATRLLRESAVSAPATCPPTVDGGVVGEGHPEYPQAARIAAFCTYNLNHVRPGLKAFLFELSEAITQGHALAEQLYDTRTLDPATGPQWVVTALKVRPPDRYAFVVDAYNNQLGVQYAAPGQPLVTTNLVATDSDGTIPHFLARRWYVHYAHWPQHGDPRGRSILRAAYFHWWFKHQTQAEYLRYLATFATPMMFMTLAPGAQPDPVTGEAPESQASTALATMRNGGYMVAAADSALTPIQVQGEGRAFLNAIDLANHEITTAVLMATRATMEAEHGSRADSGTAQDVVELGVARLRADLAGVLASDVLTPLILLNFGEAALRYLPAVALGTTERHDYPTEATATAALANTPLLHWSMYPGIRAMLNLPAADAKAEAADRDAKAALTAQLVQAPPATDGVAPGSKPNPFAKKDEAPAHG